MVGCGVPEWWRSWSEIDDVGGGRDGGGLQVIIVVESG